MILTRIDKLKGGPKQLKNRRTNMVLNQHISICVINHARFVMVCVFISAMYEEAMNCIF